MMTALMQINVFQGGLFRVCVGAAPNFQRSFGVIVSKLKVIEQGWYILFPHLRE